MNFFYYRGLPEKFTGWVSKHVYGKRGDPHKEIYSYRVFLTKNGKFGLQETDRRGTGEVEMSSQGDSQWKNRVVKVGSFKKTVKKHVECTSRPPMWFKPQPCQVIEIDGSSPKLS